MACNPLAKRSQSHRNEDGLTTPCHEWPAAKNVYGYGLKGFEGKKQLAHRIAYIKSHGLQMSEIKGLIVRHKCDNPGCVNPDHLELGTQADNMRDMFERGRREKGERHHTGTKLTAAKVAAIRARYVPRSTTNGNRALAREFGVSPSAVSKITRGESWRVS